MFPQLIRFTDLALLLLRLMVGLVFITSGYRHLKNPEARSKSIGMSKGFTIFLGTAEVAGALGLAFGVLTQLAASGLILLMLGAIQKKIFSWHTGFWGDKTYGWHYELMLEGKTATRSIVHRNRRPCSCDVRTKGRRFQTAGQKLIGRGRT